MDSNAFVRPPPSSRGGLEREEWILPFATPRERIAEVTRVRSTLIASSLQVVRDRQLIDRYRSLLPAEHQDAVLQSIAGTWLSLEVASAHYRAMDGLFSGSNETFDVGRTVAEKIQNSVLATLAKLATGGVTPWAALAQIDRLWARLFVGGAVAVSKRGPKDALCEVVGNPLVEIAYFRGAFRGLISGGLGLFCTKAYVSEHARSAEPHRIVFRLAWA